MVWCVLYDWVTLAQHYGYDSLKQNSTNQRNENTDIKIHIQYWCTEGKYRIYVARLRNGERRALASLSIRFVPSHIHSIFTVNTPISYLSCNKICKKMLFNLIIKKDNGNPIDTSVVFPVRGWLNSFIRLI